MGEYGMNKKRIFSLLMCVCLVLTLMPTFAAAVTSSDKSDITGHWAETTLQEWKQLGLLSGDGSGNYNPNSSITRAEFMAFVNRVMGYKENESAADSFSDISPDAWYYGDVSAALSAGYITGTSNSTMSPDSEITREAAISIVSRINGIGSQSALDILSKVGDASDISSWAKGFVAGAINAGYAGGSNGNINPRGYITRAEAVVLLDRVRTGSQVYNFPGTYGSNAETTKANSVVILSDGVTLVNFNVTGDVQIAASVGEGTAALTNVTAGGNIIINGGGKHSVVLSSSSCGGSMTLSSETTVRIVLNGNFAAAGGISLQTAAIVDASALTSGNCPPVVIPSTFKGSSVELLGSVGSVTNGCPGASIIMTGATIRTLNLTAPAAVSGTGAIAVANVSAGAGAGTTLPFAPGQITGAGAGGVSVTATPSSGGTGGSGGTGNTGGTTVTTGTITGTVKHDSTPLEGAVVSVTVSGTVYSAASGSDGAYTISNIPKGTGYTVSAKKFPYADGSATASVTASGTTSGVSFSLGVLGTTFTKVTSYNTVAGTLTFYGNVTVPFTSVRGCADVALGDYVNYTLSNDIYSIKKAIVITGQIDAIGTSEPQNITINNSSYLPSAEANASDLTKYTDSVADNMQLKHDYTLYLDPFGDIISLDSSKTTITGSTLNLNLTGAVKNGEIYTVTVDYFGSEALTLNASDYLTLQAYYAYANRLFTGSSFLVVCNISKSVMTVTKIQTSLTTYRLLYLLGTIPTVVYNSSSEIDYYNFPAIVDGVQTVVKATTGTLSSLNTLADDILPGALCKVTYTNEKLSEGSLTPIYATTASESNGAFAYGTGISNFSGNHVSIAGTSYACSVSTYVFYISADHSTVTAGTADSISVNSNATITAVTEAAAVVSVGGTPTAMQQNTLRAIFIQVASQ
jgi:hypothetical protein